MFKTSNAHIIRRLFQKRPPKVVVVTAYEQSFSDVAQLTIPRMAHYAKRHDFGFFVNQDPDCGRPRGWIKIPVIRSMLEGQFDFVFWLDADALIVREDVNILSAVDSRAHLQMSWLGPETTDWQAPPSLVGHFNAGILLIRVSRWSRRFFSEVWNVGDLGVGWGDQATILHLLGYDNLIGLGSENPASPFRSRVTRLDPAWNSVPGIAMAPDPVVHHYAGMPHADRLHFMPADLGFARDGDEGARQTWARELSLRVRLARTARGQ